MPDNLKSAVTCPGYYEPDLNPTYRDLGEHYGVAVIPARTYRPKEKAKAGLVFGSGEGEDIAQGGAVGARVWSGLWGGEDCG